MCVHLIYLEIISLKTVVLILTFIPFKSSSSKHALDHIVTVSSHLFSRRPIDLSRGAFCRICLGAFIQPFCLKDLCSYLSLYILTQYLSPFLQLFSPSFCPHFFHYFLLSSVVLLCTTRSTSRKPHFCRCDSGFTIFPNGPCLVSVGQYSSGVFL